MPRVSVHLVTWNSRKPLPDALDSLRAQTFREFTLTVVDNASTDGSVDCVRERFPEATVLRNFKNLGFSRAHNQAIGMARARWAAEDKQGKTAMNRYVLVMNPDVIMEPDFLEKLVAGVDGRSEIGSACGKLLRAFARRDEQEDPRRTETIDSAGIALKRTRRAVDRGAGETDGPEYAKPREVFGPSGALALYRFEALEDAAETGEIFDEDFFAYKEDVDLAWRLRLLGWKSAYVPSAVGYHYRGAGSGENEGAFSRLRGRLGRSTLVNRLSTRNQLLLLAKNEHWINGLLYAPLVAPVEFLKFLATLFAAPSVLPAYGQALLLLPKTLKKRRRIMARRKLSAAQMRKWLK